MKNLIITLLILGSAIASEFTANHFNFEDQGNGSGTLNLNLGDIEFDSHENFKKIKYSNTGQLFDVGMPDLPTFSTLYMVDKNVDYQVDYQINDSYSIEDIDLIPYFENEDKKQSFKGNQLNLNSYSQIESYPNNQLNISETKTFRDINVISIEFIPFKYFPEERRLEVYNNVDISIPPETTVAENPNIQYSRPFVKMYESIIPNFTRTEDMEFQQPAILVIGGGNSLNNNDVEDLLEWRHKQGYIIYTASTSETGTSNNSIKNYIQSAYDDFEPKPEFVTLLGDAGGSFNIPSFTESWSGYQGPGDNPYGLLDGNDQFPDVIVGRISAGNNSDMETVVNKIIHYEKATYFNQMSTDWYERAALAGDPTSSSGISTVITNMYLNDMMDEYGVEDVSTEYQNGWANFMSSKLNEGTLFLNYRGWLGVSGFGTSNINNANNGYMLPFATVLTCGTGNYSNSEALSEDFFEAGSANNPKGAIASVGTATSGTHTMYNNIVNMGMYWGLFPGQALTAGEALLHGKLHLIKTYPANYGNNVDIFSHWNNLMGDPVTHLWTDTPEEFNVIYNPNLSLGSNVVDVQVVDENNNAVEGAFITLLMDNDVVFTSKMTNANGEAVFHIENIPEGNMDITVWKRNFIPHEGTIAVTDAILSVNAVTENISIYDDGNAWPLTGNNDGMLNPGETVELTIPVKNYGGSIQSNLTVELTSNNSAVTTGDATETIVNIGANEEINVNFNITLNANAIDGEDLDLRLTVTDSDINETQSYLPVYVYGGHLVASGYSFLSGNMIDPGESKLVSIELKNLGNISLDDISGTIVAPLNTITSEETQLSWSSINSGSTVASNFIEISTNENIIKGSVIPVQLHLTSNSGYDYMEPLHIQVGVATISDPLGPDQHGYYIYDHGDLGYNLAAIYDWVEIDPNYGGNGTNLNLSNNGDGGPSLQQTTTVDLPFDFSFYGVSYDQISICTNGWVSFGETDMTSFRNYAVPGAGGPSPMIAAFWDDLKTSNGGDVYTYHDINNDAFIIEWSDMRNYSNANDDQDFQIILYNTLTPTGDGEIKIQYKTFNNTSNSGGGWSPYHAAYATIGIENHLGDDGLQYSYNNTYAETALPLGDETAIFISTRPSSPLTMGDVNQDSVINIVDVILIVNQILNPTIDILDSTQSFVADVNEDSVLNVFDIIILINIILGQ